MSNWQSLLSPLKVGGHVLRNRVLVTGHTTCYVDEESLPSDRDVAYFAARAKGGASLLCTGTNAVHSSSPLPYGVYGNFDQRIVPRHAAIAEAVHAHGALMIVQLGHLAQRNYDEPVPTWSPSPIAHHSGGAIPHEMTVTEIGEVVTAFGEAAARACEAGMDGVEVGLGHGQLINLFLSPLTNARSDRYGGSPEHRLRFAIEVMQSVRDAAGSDAIVGARVNGHDGVPEGLDADAWLAISTAVAESGLASFLSVSMDFSESLVPGMRQPHGVFLEYAAALRARVEVPVFAAGRITDPEEADQAIAAGWVDAVGMTRAHIADPDFVAKLLDGRRDAIRPCIGCGHMCIGQVQRGRPISCVYNPVTGSELTRGPQLLRAASSPRRVLVVGAGPGGMEAARVAATRGHHVTLIEREPALGGAARMASSVPGRSEFARLVDWYERQLEALEVDVRPATNADADAVEALEPDSIVLACGAAAAQPPWAGDLERATTIRELIVHEVPIAGHVAVVDQDHHGQSLQAGLLALERGCTVVVLSDRLAVAGGLEHPSLTDLYQPLLEQGGELMPMQHVRGLARADDGRLRLQLGESFSDRAHALVVDWVITTAARADERLERELSARGGGIETSVIGDARAPRQIASAVHEAFDVAVAL